MDGYVFINHIHRVLIDLTIYSATSTKSGVCPETQVMMIMEA